MLPPTKAAVSLWSGPSMVCTLNCEFLSHTATSAEIDGKTSTRESAVLMLSDAVESASRALTEPTPARIQGLVHDLAMKRLLDGQFDECGLTLEELEIIEQSLVKSLTAVYHGRVKYPDQQRTA